MSRGNSFALPIMLITFGPIPTNSSGLNNALTTSFSAGFTVPVIEGMFGQSQQANLLYHTLPKGYFSAFTNMREEIWRVGLDYKNN